MLNHIWFAFFAIATVCGTYQWLVLGELAIWQEMVKATFDMAKMSMEIALGLVGALCLWLGLLNIAKHAGLVEVLGKFLAPLFARLMPEVPRGHPALGHVTMNIAANMIGLDNAATPIGLKAMSELQTLNSSKDTATNAQILFLVLNTASLTLLPVTIFIYRAQMGAADPASVFIPILLATACSALSGLIAVAWIQRLPIFDRVVFAYFAFFALLISAIALYFSGLAPPIATAHSAFLGNFTLFAIIMGILSAGIRKKVAVYECFIEGAKEGFEVAVRLIPYLVAMLVAIGVLRASGALEGLLAIISWLVERAGIDSAFVPALPTGIMKTFSGSGARAMMIETMQHYGVDSFPALVSAIIQGSTETTFYVLAVYFGSVGITKTRHAIACGLFADVVGITAAIFIAYWFFG